MGCCNCDDARGDLYQSTLLNPRTPAQFLVTRLIDVFLVLLFHGILYYSVVSVDYSPHAAFAVYIFVTSNSMICFWLRTKAEEDWLRLSDAEKQEFPSKLCFPTNKAGRVIMVLWLVAFVLLPLAMLLFGGPLLDNLGYDDSD
jgi:hypothetical protein